MKTVIRAESKMKDSKINWLGKIPIEWNVSRVGNFFSFSSGDSLTNEYIRDEGSYLVYGANGIRGYYSKFNLNTKRILLGRVGALAGNVHIVNEKVWVTEHALIASNKLDVIVEYYGYVFESMNLIQYSKSSAQPVISGDTLQKLRFPVPSLSEQQAIADYLDETCSKIDEIIAEAKASIDEYKELKQSIIDYILSNDAYPRIRIKYVASIYGRIGFRGYTTGDMVNEGEGAITLSPSNLENGLMKYTRCSYISWEKYNESPEIMIKLNDVLMVKTGSSYGKVALVDVLPLEATINPQLIVFKNIKGDNKYFSYCMQSTMVQNQIAHIVSGGTIPTLSQEKIKNMKIYYPPLSEQIEIVKYLDRKTAEIDSLISEKQSLIADLEAYKKSLIYEVVTGKRRVV